MPVVDSNGVDTTALAADFHEVYTTDTLFAPAEKREAKFLDSMAEAKNVKRLMGKRLNWRVEKNYGWGTGSPGEYSEWSKAGKRDQGEARVNASALDSVIEITLEALERSGDGASYDVDLVDQQVQEAATVLALMGEFRALADGTGALALVRSNTVASDLFQTATNDSGIGGPQKLRAGMTIDIADATTGGVVQYAGVHIDDLDPVTGDVNTDTVMSLDAGWSVFIRDTYGASFMEGVDSIVASTGTIFGLARADSEKYRGVVIGADDTLVAYSEDIMDALFINLTQRSGYVPSYLLCNEGIAVAHRRLGGKDKIYPVLGDKMPIFGQGGDHENTWYQWGSERVPFKVNKNVSPRVVYGLYAPSIKKAYLRRPDWFRGETGNSGNPRLQIKPGTNNWTYIVTGSLLQKLAVICDALNANGKVPGIRDTLLGEAGVD